MTKQEPKTSAGATAMNDINVKYLEEYADPALTAFRAYVASIGGGDDPSENLAESTDALSDSLVALQKYWKDIKSNPLNVRDNTAAGAKYEYGAVAHGALLVNHEMINVDRYLESIPPEKRNAEFKKAKKAVTSAQEFFVKKVSGKVLPDAKDHIMERDTTNDSSYVDSKYQGNNGVILGTVGAFVATLCASRSFMLAAAAGATTLVGTALASGFSDKKKIGGYTDELDAQKKAFSAHTAHHPAAQHS